MTGYYIQVCTDVTTSSYDGSPYCNVRVWQYVEIPDFSLSTMFTPENLPTFAVLFMSYWALIFVFKQLVKLIEQV